MRIFGVQKTNDYILEIFKGKIEDAFCTG